MAVYLIRCLLSLCLLVVSGCSINYVNSKGEEVILGFVSLKAVGAGCAAATNVKSIGISYDSTERSGGLNLGYRSVMKVYVHDYELIDFNVEGGDQVIVNSYKLPRERGECSLQLDVPSGGESKNQS